MSPRARPRPLGAGLVAAVAVLLLVPFAGKPFHIDDPLFLWVAKRIQAAPLDPYGFDVNWYGKVSAASVIIKNPPLASYFLALAASLGGWHEVALHLALLLPAVGAALGTYALASRVGARPDLAALACVASPVFLLSATGVMCDVTMLALWVWAVVLWMKGTEDGRTSQLVLGALLVALASLTKYFGMSLVPLLLAYTLARRDRPRSRAAILLIPAALLAGYQLLTHRMYGRGLLLDAAAYATDVKKLGAGAIPSNVLIGLAFTGGGLTPLLCYAHLLLRRKGRWVALGAALLLVPAAAIVIGGYPRIVDGGVRWLLAAEVAAMAAVGVGVLLLAAAELRRRRDPVSLLLFLWVAGTFAFGTFLNWTINARSLLPIAPAAAILLARRVTDGSAVSVGRSLRALAPLLPAVLIAWAAAWGDYRCAASARGAADAFRAEFAPVAHTLWFRGHWGFQYYMEAAGAKPIDRRRSELLPGDVIAVPENNANTEVRFLPMDRIRILGDRSFVASSWVATMDPSVGAGFYTAQWGPLPFAFAPATAQAYRLAGVTARIALAEINRP